LNGDDPDPVVLDDLQAIAALGEGEQRDDRDGEDVLPPLRRVPYIDRRAFQVAEAPLVGDGHGHRQGRRGSGAVRSTNRNATTRCACLGTDGADPAGYAAAIGKDHGNFAALVLRSGRPIPVNSLADQLWGDKKPDEARRSLYTYIARLRRLLRTETQDKIKIVRSASSYTMQVDPLLTDVHLARMLVREAESAAADGRHDDAVRLYRQALRHWRGEPLCGLPGAWAEFTSAGLKRERLSTLINYFAAELRLGRHAQVIGELSSAVAEYPLDEVLASQLMLSLYRSHRRAEALDVYRLIKAELADRLGVDPGPTYVNVTKRCCATVHR
jgi:DNA-binding SARP family transcriptional activator